MIVVKYHYYGYLPDKVCDNCLAEDCGYFIDIDFKSILWNGIVWPNLLN